MKSDNEAFNITTDESSIVSVNSDPKNEERNNENMYSRYKNSENKHSLNDLPFDFPVSLAQAMDLTDEARVICSFQYPHIVLHANKAWTQLCGYQLHEIQGKSLKILQGEQTNLNAIRQMMYNVNSSGFGNAEVVNYKKSNEAMMVSIQIQPIVASNIFGEKHYSHLLGRTKAIKMIENPMIYAASDQQLEGYTWMINNTLFQESDKSDEQNESSENSDGSDENNRGSDGSITHPRQSQQINQT